MVRVRVRLTLTLTLTLTPGAADGKPPLKPGESPLAVGQGAAQAKPRPKKRSPSEIGDQQDRLETLAQQAIDRIRVLEADGQLRREHAKKIEHKLDEQARAQLRLEVARVRARVMG